MTKRQLWKLRLAGGIYARSTTSVEDPEFFALDKAEKFLQLFSKLEKIDWEKIEKDSKEKEKEGKK